MTPVTLKTKSVGPTGVFRGELKYCIDKIDNISIFIDGHEKKLAYSAS
jgi:hypothetical protein